MALLNSTSYLSFLRMLLKNKSGATAIEYGLYAMGISLAILPAVQLAGTNTKGTFVKANQGLVPKPYLADGTEGDDVLIGASGKINIINGRGGNDFIRGGAQNDTLSGDAGDDIIFGEGGDDAINGGDGNDAIVGGAGADTIDGGAGENMASYHNSGSGVNVDLGAGTASGGDADGDVLTNIQNLTGSNFADVLNGDNSANTISGNGGDDVLNGLGGNDTISGDAGNDIINGGSGNDFVNGGDGDDTVNGGDGDDTVMGGAGADILNGGDGIDTASYVYASGNVTVNLLTGTGSGGDAEGDILSGFENIESNVGNDTLIGNAGNNVLTGNAGNDTLIGGAGADTLNGGADFDIASYAAAGGGIQFNTNGTQTGDATGDTFSGIEGCVFTPYTDYITFGGEMPGVTYVDAGAGDDHIGFGAGVTVIGGLGNDTFYPAGSAQNTTFVLNQGDGSDYMNAFFGGNSNTIRFGDGITQQDLSFRLKGSEMILTYGDGDELRMANGTSFYYTPTDIQFSDNSSTSVWNTLLPSTGIIVDGTEMSGAQSGMNWVNNIEVKIMLEPGDGNDRFDAYAGLESVNFAAGINPGDVHYSILPGGNIVMTYGAGDSLRFNEGTDMNRLPESIHFSGGINTDFKSQTYEIVTTSGNDALSGMNCFGGCASLVQEFHIDAGGGQDTVSMYNPGATNRIVFGAGIAPGDLSFTNNSGNLVVSYGGGNSVTFNEAIGDAGRRVQTINFDGGGSCTIDYNNLTCS
ncbi:MAG: Flp family type IVb pilin [Pseudomonadota bacterium]